MKKPTDMFSFGLLCIYATTKEIILAVDKKPLPETIQLEDAVIQLPISYYADLDGVRGLVNYYGDSHWAHYIAVVANEFSEENPRRPSSSRPDHDHDFKSLITQIIYVDSRRRLTAKEAYPWFAEAP
ncbi:serine/threonine protein kinase (calcium/calmodulin dependent protein kinase) [Stagonosporopsis vannaccii]|nr:serine/threonine protein kinase (calcium/calmodulin dependent protein kinase) [Stagonosporopsis vannaccii]